MLLMHVSTHYMCTRIPRVLCVLTRCVYYNAVRCSALQFVVYYNNTHVT